ncbi:PIN domain-containing protein [Flavobacterium sp. SORGH_AS_0622]|uniref:PIN domain-containing protein n=1 Tax=Flavobacterium sp. SORGH_AS_0622 TaxID=3041772 RepID=UPI0027843192|nr:PIN domain-containing protein [Flavobacterium sp. SORGH_AS_0622]MDQ1167335.1 hypothetical protein [Flavobacterium sp. SORGH_AS_0622]
MAKKNKLKLKVIFDTNVIFTGSASDLLRNEIVELINSHKSLSDIEIEWYIPETVIKERIFQMNKRGNELLPSIQKLEKLLGHKLNITKEIIEEKVLNIIGKQLVSLDIQTIKLDTSKIDWNLIINNSLTRQIPFEDNEKEKGFRDALILEGLKQVIAVSPKTKSICRIAFITGDNILNAAASTLARQFANVDVFSSTSEFVSLINIIDSKITEVLINAIIEDAEKLFFEKGQNSTLYYTQNLRKHITEHFPKELNTIQDGALTREIGTWWIAKPGFEKKNKQLLTWKTIISVDFSDYKITYATMPVRSAEDYYSISRPNTNLGMGLGIDTSANSVFRNTESYGMMATGNSYRQQFSPIKEKVAEGKITFEVTWSVTLGAGNKLKNAKIESVNLADTIIQ